MGGGSSTTNPEIPEQLRGLYSAIGGQLTQLIGQMPLDGGPLGDSPNFLDMPPQEYAPMDPLENYAYGQIPGMFQPHSAGADIYSGAMNLMNPAPWKGVNLGGAGAYSIGGVPYGPQPENPQSIGGFGGIGIGNPGPPGIGGPAPMPAPEPTPVKPGGGGGVPASSAAGGIPYGGAGAHSGPPAPTRLPSNPFVRYENFEDIPGDIRAGWSLGVGDDDGGGWNEGHATPVGQPQITGDEPPPPYDWSQDPGEAPPPWTPRPGEGGGGGAGGMPAFGMGSGPAPLALPGHVAPGQMLGQVAPGQMLDRVQGPSLPKSFDPSQQYNVADYGGIPTQGDISATQVDPYQEIGHWAEGIDLQNHPALTAAMEAFTASTQPQIANQMENLGLGSSGATGDAMAKARAQIALPVMQQVLGAELQNKGMDIQQRLGARGQDVTQRGQTLGSMGQMAGIGAQMRGQDISGFLGGRGQDIGALMQKYQGEIGQRGQDLGQMGLYRGQDIQQRGQDYGQMLGYRGQDIGQRGTDISAILGGRGQDLNALLQQGSQALQAQGLAQSGMLGGMGALAGLRDQDLQQMMAALGQAGDWGGRYRSREDAVLGAEHDERMRQYELAMQALFGPMGGLSNLIGSSTREGK
jgi:hypothetical protein